MSTEIVKLKKEGELWVIPLFGNRYAFREWTWGEKNALLTECSRLMPQGTYELDSTKFNEGFVLKTAFKEVDGKFVPFEVNELRNMRGKLVDYIFQITQKLNLVSQSETVNL